nr:uncharacterized protein LOC107450675 [Parasteatoda tepidariorum]
MRCRNSQLEVCSQNFSYKKSNFDVCVTKICVILIIAGFFVKKSRSNKMSRSQSTRVTRSTSRMASSIAATVPAVGESSESENEQLLMILKSDNSSHLIGESFKKIESERQKTYVDSLKDLMNFFPKKSEEEDEFSLKTARREALFEDAIATFVACFLIISISLLSFYARHSIVSSMLPAQVLELGKFWTPCIYCLVIFVLLREKLSSYF